MQKIKSFLVNLIVLVIAMLILLLLTEIALHIMNIPKIDTPPEDYRKPHEVYHHAFIPNSSATVYTSEYTVEFKINSLGLRDYEYALKKLGGKFRILMLGDSFTQGSGVNIDDTIAKKLEKELQKESGSIEVINAGQSSFSPILEYLYLKTDGLKFEPDMVILNFDMSDVQDDYLYEKKAIFENGEIVAVPGDIKEKEKWTQVTSEICKKIRLCLIAVMAKDNVLLRYYQSPHMTVGDINSDRWFLTRNEVNESYLRMQMKKSFEYIDKINSLLKRNNITFILVTYPYAHQITTNEWVTGRRQNKFDTSQLYSPKPIEILEEFGKSNGIYTINLLPDFLASKEHPLFYDLDVHMTATGYGLMAQGIAERLIRDRLIPY